MPYLFTFLNRCGSWVNLSLFSSQHFRHKQSQKCYPKISTYREKCLTLNRKNVLTRQHNLH
uniref:Uncharacterized protein n=1 Tax=Anguilla anguilla TaxID=7936 RepID=A0A0E9U5F4_ANGAN